MERTDATLGRQKESQLIPCRTEIALAGKFRLIVGVRAFYVAVSRRQSPERRIPITSDRRVQGLMRRICMC